jgi:hypothetical protein
MIPGLQASEKTFRAAVHNPFRGSTARGGAQKTLNPSRVGWDLFRRKGRPGGGLQILPGLHCPRRGPKLLNSSRIGCPREAEI